MPNPFFSFKQFTVYHDRCAMKVGTDGVLLGAWADVSGVQKVLDVGTGTGLMALMLAQRCEAQIVAVDVDEGAVEQARWNVAASPWADRIRVEQADICRYRPSERFDLVVSNPPYFVDALKCPDRQRSLARHADGLDFGQLMQAMAALLQPEGRACVVIPADGRDALLASARRAGLSPVRQTWVHTKPGAEPKRVLLAFRFQEQVTADGGVGSVLPDTARNVASDRPGMPGEPPTDHLTIELSRHVYSEEYIALTRDFYLKM
ncbi:SAM-dependent methyltransferase [gut metagenome]|uniref:SAM-dependent methyltransferase n=1 Tax=gut metagenome TaxID=749906 RepID=J9G8Y7_9ZZZZ